MSKVLLMTFNASYIHPNLALRWLYVARDKSHDVIIKEYTLKDNISKVIDDIESIKPDVIGMSVYIWNSEKTKELVRALKPHQYRIILGGPEVSYEYEKWLSENIEAIIKGEGEISFWQAVNRQENVLGLVTKNKDTDTYGYTDIAYLETLESPYFLSMDDDSRANRYLYFESSRGCPYRCAYCLSSLDNRVRNFSIDYIKKQLKALEKKTPKQVKFLDRTFNSNPDRALEIASYINDLNVDTSFQFEVALEFFSPKLLEFFANTKKGKFRFEVGVQSFNDETLKSIRRYQNADKLTANIHFLKQNDIVMHTDLIAGLPYEDYDSFKNSFFKLFSLKTDEIQMGILKLLKGTSLRSDCQKYAITYNELPPYEVLSTAWISKEEMDRIKLVAKVIDKTYNSKRLKETFDILFIEGYDIFEIMADYGSRIVKIDKIQVYDYFMALYLTLEEFGYKDASRLILNDYYKQFKEKPKALFERPDQEIRKDFYRYLISLGYDEHELNEYSIFDHAYKNQKAIYQLVTYSNKHHLQSIRYFDLDFNLIDIIYY